MKFHDIHALVREVPFIRKKNAHFLYDLILEHKLTRVLELGIGHGTSTCYIAAALQELGEGCVTAVDLIETRDTVRPSAEQQLEQTGLANFAQVVRMQTGYSWFLHDEIVRNTVDDQCQEIYNLCIIDGPKNWTIDGGAFFLVDKLLQQDGWLIFDDYHWTYASPDAPPEATDGIAYRRLSQAELETPHIRDVFELLVKQHPSYGSFMLLEDDDWAVARKTPSSKKTYEIVHRTTTSDLFAKLCRKAYHRVKRLGGSQ